MSNIYKSPYVPQSLKLHYIKLCFICGQIGNSSSIFTCQICKKNNVHFWCADNENFKLGIYICSPCNNLRKESLNEVYPY